MAQFDVFRIKNKSGFFIAVQNEMLDETLTTVIVPLKPRTANDRPVSRLNPVLSIGEREYVFVAQSIGTVPNEWLTTANISLATERYRIIAALDFLFTGV